MMYLDKGEKEREREKDQKDMIFFLEYIFIGTKEKKT